jgi:hypothetical protein
LRDENRILWNEGQKRLQSIIQDKNFFEESKKLCLKQHAMLHSSNVSENALIYSFEDDVWQGLTEEGFRGIPDNEEDSIAWVFLHMTRIEDITMNILIADDAQVFNSGNWMEKMNIKVKDTGNAMTKSEIQEMSATIDQAMLRNYRYEVAKKTRQIISLLKAQDMKKKSKPLGLIEYLRKVLLQVLKLGLQTIGERKKCMDCF